MTTPIRILRSHGIRPRKHMGQSFLQDLNVAQKIVDFADIRPDETVVEIGAGLGIMTGLMAVRARRVIALDVDPAMIVILRERLARFSNAEIVETDVLKYDFFSAVPPHSSEKLKVVGNIPYHISSPIVFRLMDFRRCISQIVMMMQKEVVDRIVAMPGTRDYGIPSVMISMFCSARRLMNVPPGCFHPEPKVVSSVLRLEIRDTPRVNLKDEMLFCRLVRLAFAKRRKTLANNLRHARMPGYSAEAMMQALRNCGTDGARRAETLTAEEFGLLANCLRIEEKA